MGSKGLGRPQVNGDLWPTPWELSECRTVAPELDALGDEPYCYLTTTGRRTGLDRTIEIWFAILGPTVYLLSGGGAGDHWVRNLLREPAVRIRIGGAVFAGRARLLDRGAEEADARRRLLEKYQPTYAGDLTEWSRTSVPVAIDLTVSPEAS